MSCLHVFPLTVINVDDAGQVIVTRIPGWRLVQAAAWAAGCRHTMCKN